MDKLYIIAPLSSLSGRTRLYKLIRFLQSQYPHIKIVHIGWERHPGESDERYLKNVTIEKNIVLKGGGYGGNKVRLMYFLWIARVLVRSFRIERNAHVWALGFESAFPAVLASKLKQFEVYFDDADRFSMLFPLPKGVKRFIERLEKYTSRHARHHIIPSLERYDFESAKFYILRNMPSESEILAARDIYRSKVWPRASVVININGWLGQGRGMEAALTLAKAFPPEDLSVILVGKLDCPAAEELARLPNTRYLGRVSNSEALASYYASDLVFTYYDPASQINRLAESNKWGDALKTGIGVIVNSEVLTAQYLRDAGAALSVPYNDYALLIEKVKEMIANTNLKERLKQNAIQLANQCGFFEQQLAKLFATASS